MFEELIEAIEQKNNEKAIELIALMNQEELSKTDKHGNSALHTILYLGADYKIVELLLDKMSLNAIFFLDKMILPLQELQEKCMVFEVALYSQIVNGLSSTPLEKKGTTGSNNLSEVEITALNFYSNLHPNCSRLIQNSLIQIVEENIEDVNLAGEGDYN